MSHLVQLPQVLVLSEILLMGQPGPVSVSPFCYLYDVDNRTSPFTGERERQSM